MWYTLARGASAGGGLNDKCQFPVRGVRRPVRHLPAGCRAPPVPPARWFSCTRTGAMPGSSSSRLIHDEGQPSYSVRLWRSPGGARIGPGIGSAVPEVFADAILHGVPVPRHGSLLGWDDGRDHHGTDRFLCGVHAPVSGAFVGADAARGHSRNPVAPVRRRVRPRAMVLEVLPGRADRLARRPHRSELRAWFSGRTQRRSLALDCCVVADDIVESFAGPTLQRGRYVYYEALRAGKPVPSLEALLAGAKIDLAPRLRLRPRRKPATGR